MPSKLRVLVAAMVLSAIVLMGWFFLWADGVPNGARSASPPARAAGEQPEMPSLPPVERAPALEVPSDPEREPVAQSSTAAVSAPPEADPKEAIVLGRCVAAETGQALSGCIVKLDGMPGNDGEMALHGPVTWHAPEPVTTLADGRFEIRFEPPPPYQHGLDIACEGRVPRTARWGAFQPGQVEDLGDIRLARGVHVRGQVVDTAGTPVERVGVSVSNLPLPVSSGMAANDTRSGWSDAGGRFEFKVPVPQGTWPLDVEGRGYTLVEPHEVVVGDGSGPVELRVVVKAQRFLAGVVVDETGNPVNHVYLKTISHRSGKMESSWTRDDGRFRIFARDDSPEAVQLESSDPGPCEPLQDERFFTWGTTDIRLVMRRALALQVTVVEPLAGGEVPVEDFAVKCHARDARSSRDTEARLGGHHEGGRLTVDKIRRGANVLRVIPKDRALALSDEIAFEANDQGVPPMRIELQRMVKLEVHVITDANEPIAGSRLELVQRRGERLDLSRWVEDLRSDAMISSSSPLPLLLSSAITDADGFATLCGPAGALDLAIRALGPGHVPLLREGIELPSPQSPLEIEVGRSGALRGKLTGDVPREYHARVALQPMAPLDLDLDLPHNGYVVEADGSFMVASLPAGDYHVLLAIETGVHDAGGGFSSQTRLLPALGTVHVDEGRETSVEFDATAFAPGSLDARLVLDAERLKGCRVSLHGSSGQQSVQLPSIAFEQASEWSLGVFVPSPSGALGIEHLPPGEYTLSLSFADDTHETHRFLELPQTVTIRPREKTVCTFEIAWQRLRVRVLAADGSPLARTECEVMAGHHAIRVSTDAEGWLTLDPAPAASVRISVNGRGVSEPVSVPEGEPEAEQTVKLGGDQ